MDGQKSLKVSLSQKKGASRWNTYNIYCTTRRPYVLVKRAFDFFLSALAILVLSPLFLVVALLIKLDSKGPVIFRQERVGLHKKVFSIYKFRTMYVTAPKYVATNDLEKPDRFITRIGRFLRKSSIDELPQLFNVLKGDMSLVGPRPVLTSETEIHALRENCGIYEALRPGVTGWAQVHGRDLVDAEQKVALDEEYLNRCSFKTDLIAFFKTFAVVLFGSGYAEGKQEKAKPAEPCEKDVA